MMIQEIKIIQINQFVYFKGNFLLQALNYER